MHSILNMAHLSPPGTNPEVRMKLTAGWNSVAARYVQYASIDDMLSMPLSCEGHQESR